MFEIVLAILCVLVASAICSGTEAAFFSVSHVKARQLAQTGRPAGKALLHIRENMQDPIGTIVIFNNIANIIGTAVVTAIADNHFNDGKLEFVIFSFPISIPKVGVVGAILTVLVIVFSEIIPKGLGEQYNQSVSLLMARPVKAVAWLLTPVLWCLKNVQKPFSKNDSGFSTNEAEIKLLASLGQKEGIIEEDEGEMIKRVFELNDLTAGDLLTPRVVMTWLRGNQTLDEAREAILESTHSRIIIVGEEVDDILGFALKSELLRAIIDGYGAKPVGNFANEVRVVPRQMKADALLLMFRRSRQHLSVVLDEFGGVAGVITLEDVLEILTGEIMDETDKVANMQKAAVEQQQIRRAHLDNENFPRKDVQQSDSQESDAV